MKPKHVLIFLIVNIILIAGVFSFEISPRLQNVSRLGGVVSRQEALVAQNTRIALDYENNLQKLQDLNESRTFLLYEHEVRLEFSKIEQLIYANNLQAISLYFSEQLSFHTYDGQYISRTSARIDSYGAVADIFNFLHELEDTFARIITADIVWREDYRARINIEFELLAMNI